MTKTIKIVLIVSLVLVLTSLAFAGGCIFTKGKATATIEGPDTRLINEAWDKIAQNYVEPGKIDTTALNEGAINGIVQGLNDPYSYYLNPTDFEITQANFKSSFGGIGATISANKDKQPIIVNTMEDSPAAKAGILPQDIILAVNGKATEGQTVDQVVSQVRGDVGTTVILIVLHADQSVPVEISIVRGEINPKTVSSKMVGDILYIKITNFYESTNDEVNAVLKNMDPAATRGIIIDLRDNLGGLVDAMINIASHFIKSGVILTLRDNQGKTDSLSAVPNGVFTELPVMVLVNEYSASASEILAGSMQDYKRATIAGVKTFGKGSYDAFYPLSDGSGIYLTIGRWLTPNKREIEGVGITPDQVITQTGDDAVQWAADYLDNRK
jgi:carboxyl-terminal processing protease